MVDIRKPKKSDQTETEKAFQILRKCMQDHPEIEPTLWMGAHLSCIVSGCENSGISYQEFSSELESVKMFYKERFEEDLD